jgi:hypothetical protein
MLNIRNKTIQNQHLDCPHFIKQPLKKYLAWKPVPIIVSVIPKKKMQRRKCDYQIPKIIAPSDFLKPKTLSAKIPPIK